MICVDLYLSPWIMTLSIPSAPGAYTHSCFFSTPIFFHGFACFLLLCGLSFNLILFLGFRKGMCWFSVTRFSLHNFDICIFSRIFSFFALNTIVLKYCHPALTEKELEWLILLWNGKTLFQVAIRKFLAVRRGANSCRERATELGISTEVIYASAMWLIC